MEYDDHYQILSIQLILNFRLSVKGLVPFDSDMRGCTVIGDGYFCIPCVWMGPVCTVT